LLRAARDRKYNRNAAGGIFDRLFTAPRMALAGAVLMSIMVAGFFMVSNILDKVIALKKLDSLNQFTAGGDISTIGLNQSGAVQISMDSQEAVKDVDFEIELPNGLCIVRSGKALCSEKKLHWSGDLQKGENIVIISVKGTIKGDWKVHANVRKNNSRKKVEIPLSVI